MIAPAARWLDLLAESDPGLNRLRTALLMVASVAAAVAGEWMIVQFTQAPAPAVPASHEVTVIAELIGALVALLSVLFVTEPGPGAQLVSSALVIMPMIAFMAVGLLLGAWRVPSLVFLTTVLAGGTYLRRFGARGFMVGIMIFVGFFLGFFLRGSGVTLSGLGRPSAEAAVGLAAALIVRFGLFYPRPDQALRRTLRSHEARGRKLISEALAVLSRPGAGTSRLSRQLTRLNETALMIDAQLGDPAALPRGSARRLHDRVFAAELALSDVALFTVELARLGLPPARTEPVRLILTGLRAGDLLAVRAAARDMGDEEPAAARRVARAALAFTVAMNNDPAMNNPAEKGRDGTSERFQPAVVTSGGWLLGAAAASAAASGESASHFWDRARLKPYSRAAIQVGVAAGLATVAGGLVSGAHFYWALFAVVVTFAGPGNAGEQVERAVLRTIGTAVGVAAGSVLAVLTGDNAWGSLAIILASQFLGTYFARVNYALLTTGVTVTVAQVYAQLGEYSAGLLLVRLEETAVGAAAGLLTAVAVLPLRSRRVLGVAARSYVDTLMRVLAHVPDGPGGVAGAGALGGASEIGGAGDLDGDARRLDDATHVLIAAARPFRNRLLGKLGRQATELAALAETLRHQARSLLSGPGTPGADGRAIDRSIETLVRVAAEIALTAHGC